MTMQDLILAHAPREAMHARLADISLLNVECYYFGYVKGCGHTFCLPRNSGYNGSPYDLERVVGAALARGGLDGKLCWNSPRGERDQYARRDENEGRAFRTSHGGWTAVAFWDRSQGDPRGACNTAFLARGDLTFSQVIRAAKHAWPEVWARFTFPVVEVDARGQEVRHG